MAGWLTKILGIDAAADRIISTQEREAEAGRAVTVVGSGYYGGERILRPGRHSGELRRERANPHDQNAVAVWCGEPEVQCGHLPAEVAAIVGPRMDAAHMRVTYVPLIVDAGMKVFVSRRFLPAMSESAAGRRLPVDDVPRRFQATIEPWGACIHSCEVEEEHLHRQEILSVFLDHGAAIPADGSELNGLKAILSLSGTRPNTVVVQIQRHVVGAISDPEVVDMVRSVDRRQLNLAVPARLWALDDNRTVRARATVMLPATSLVDPPGPLPREPHVVLPSGTKVQVTGEEHYLNELTAILAGEDGVPVVATLHEVTPARDGAKGRVRVAIREQTVGYLTATMSEHFLPIIQACDEEGLTVVCRATVKGNSVKADVLLDAARAGDLSQDWITRNLQPGDLLDESQPETAPLEPRSRPSASNAEQPSPPATVPPQWAPDPSRAHELRWWDGIRWSEHVVDRGVQLVDPFI